MIHIDTAVISRKSAQCFCLVCGMLYVRVLMVTVFLYHIVIGYIFAMSEFTCKLKAAIFSTFCRGYFKFAFHQPIQVPPNMNT